MSRPCRWTRRRITCATGWRCTAPPAPQEHIRCDVALITTCRFPGGNASTSLDEVNFFRGHGLDVRLIHCPADGGLGKEDSPRYAVAGDVRTDWNRIASLQARVVICRAPLMLTSMAFAALAGRITAGATFVVINNSIWREDGSAVYDFGAIHEAVGRIATGSLHYCPIGPLIRSELVAEREKLGLDFAMAEIDWTPTFDLALYKADPKPQMPAPYRLGRHGRDSAEKWHEDKHALRKVYPDAEDFQIRVLGGAKYARRILKKLPANWVVHEFGAIEAHEYLAELDVFAYFPHSQRIEAFGRTIVEAMLAGVPVLLPRAFAATFGELPIYCEPHQVAGIVRALAADDAARVAFLTDVQTQAIDLFSSRVIAARVVDTGLLPDAVLAGGGGGISAASLAYKRGLEAIDAAP